MGLFGNGNKKEEAKQEESQEEDLMSYDDCSNDFKEADLDENNRCKDCAKKAVDEEKIQQEAVEKFGYKFAMSFRADAEGNQQDEKAVDKISKEDAKKLYEAAKEAIGAGKKYFEIPEMITLDDDDEESTFFPEYIFIGEVDRVYYESME